MLGKPSKTKWKHFLSVKGSSSGLHVANTVKFQSRRAVSVAVSYRQHLWMRTSLRRYRTALGTPRPPPRWSHGRRRCRLCPRQDCSVGSSRGQSPHCPNPRDPLAEPAGFSSAASPRTLQGFIQLFSPQYFGCLLPFPTDSSISRLRLGGVT